MRGALGNSLLLSIILTFVGAIVIFFVSILSYSKAYKAKNRIIEVIEKYETYDQNVKEEVNVSLAEMGYQLGECQFSSLADGNGYKYCVEYKEASAEGGGYYYKVSTYVQFYFPIIGEIITPKVTSETKILGRNYDFE